jgi:hypothetical protein
MFSAFQYNNPRLMTQRRRILAGLALTIGIGVLTLFNITGALVFALVALWAIWSMANPQGSFLTLLLYFLVFYGRTTMGDLDIAGSADRGAIRIGDIMWIIAFGCVAVRRGLGPRQWRMMPPKKAAILPYIILACMLPVVGILSGSWPMSYAVPGFRHLQWASFAWMAYILCSWASLEAVWGQIVKVIAWSCIIHAGYAFLQVGYAVGFIPRSFLYLDDLLVRTKATTWFYYPRTTGLFLNPNSYGIYSAICVMMGLLLSWAQGRKIWLWNAMMVCGVFGMITSGSRSALAGLLLGVAALYLRPMAITKQMMKPLLNIGMMMLLLVAIVYLTAAYIPESIRARFVRMALVSREGADADANLAARVDSWKALHAEYQNKYPWGTWVPASYALESPMDSYYAQTWAQGTPVFVCAFILLMMAAIFRGRHLAKSALREHQTAGLSLVATSGVILAASVAASPLLQPHINAIFWSLLGVVMAVHAPARIGLPRVACLGSAGAWQASPVLHDPDAEGK